MEPQQGIKKFIFCAFCFLEFHECIFSHGLLVDKAALFSCSCQFEYKSFYFSLFWQRYHKHICVWCSNHNGIVCRTTVFGVQQHSCICLFLIWIKSCHRKAWIDSELKGIYPWGNRHDFIVKHIFYFFTLLQ